MNYVGKYDATGFFQNKKLIENFTTSEDSDLNKFKIISNNTTINDMLNKSFHEIIQAYYVKIGRGDLATVWNWYNLRANKNNHISYKYKDKDVIEEYRWFEFKDRKSIGITMVVMEIKGMFKVVYYRKQQNYNTLYNDMMKNKDALYCMMDPEARPHLQYADSNAKNCIQDRKDARLKELKFDKIDELPNDVGSYKMFDYETKIIGATDEASINNFFNEAIEAEKTAKDFIIQLKLDKIKELPNDVGSYKRSVYETKINDATDVASINNFFNEAIEAEKTAKATPAPTTPAPTTPAATTPAATSSIQEKSDKTKKMESKKSNKNKNMLIIVGLLIILFTIIIIMLLTRKKSKK